MPAMFIWLTFLSLRLLRGAREDRRIAADDLQEADDLANQVVVVGDVIFLVGCVNVVIRQAGAHEDDRHMQFAVEERADRNRAAGTFIGWWRAPLLLQCLLCRAHEDVIHRHQHRIATVNLVNGHLYSWWAELRNALLQQRQYLGWAQTRWQAQAHFGSRLGGDDGFRAVPYEATFDAMYFQRRAGGGAFDGVYALLTGQYINAHLLHHLRWHIHRIALPQRAFFVCHGLQALVEFGDGDFAIGSFEARQYQRQRVDRIWADAAEFAGVQIMSRALRMYLGVDDAAQPIDQRGHARRWHAGICHQRHVTGEPFRMLFDIRLDGFATGLFFALDQHTHIDGQRPIVRVHQRFERLHQPIHLPFVVHGAARIEVVVANLWLKGVTEPLVSGVYRLDIIVTVKQDSGLAFGLQPFAVDERMPCRFDDIDVLDAGARQGVCNELSGALDILFVFRQCADAGNTQERLQFFEEGVAVLFDIGERRPGSGIAGRHAGFLFSSVVWYLLLFSMLQHVAGTLQRCVFSLLVRYRMAQEL